VDNSIKRLNIRLFFNTSTVDNLWITQGQLKDKKSEARKGADFLAENKVQKLKNFLFSFSLSQTQGKIEKKNLQRKALKRAFQIRLF